MSALRELEDALFHHDLERVRACPLSLLQRTDACVNYLTEHGVEDMLVAPLACAIQYALNALRDRRGDKRLLTADGGPTPWGGQMMDGSREFRVLDYFLNVCWDLEAPLDGVISREGGRVKLTPLMYALSDHWFRAQGDFLEVAGVLQRLLRKGVRLWPNPANHHPWDPYVRASPLCFALHQVHVCPFLFHRFVQVGARLAPGEGPLAARACMQGGTAEQGVAALHMLLPLYAGTLFANEAEQVQLARCWNCEHYIEPELLDALFKLGLRLTPAVRSVLLSDALQDVDAPSRGAEARRAPSARGQCTPRFSRPSPPG